MFKYKHLYRTASIAVRVGKRICISSTYAVDEGCIAVLKVLNHENWREPGVDHQTEKNQRNVLKSKGLVSEKVSS